MGRDICSDIGKPSNLTHVCIVCGTVAQQAQLVRGVMCNALGDMCSDECCLVLMRSGCRFRFRGLVYHDIIGSEGSVQSSDEMHRGGS